MRETGQQASRNLGKCPKCGKSTPLRSGSCLYCGAYLDDVKPLSESDSHRIIVEEPRQLGVGAQGGRHQKVYDGRGHYLFLGAREPLSLEPNKLFLIGRDPHSGLVVHSAEVSRQHCEIDWRGEPPRPVLVEVRARNGTYVNDRQLRRGEPESLRDRDVIRLGRDFEVVYRQLDERELKETLGEAGRADTRAIKLGAQVSPPPQPAPPPAPLPVPGPGPAPMPVLQPMPVAATAAYAPPPQASLLPETGDMAQIPGSVLLDTLHRERRSGKLTVFDGQTAGEVLLVEGRAKVALFGGFQSRDALETIARTTRGVYRFVPDAPAPVAPPSGLMPGAAPPGMNPLAAMALGMSPAPPAAQAAVPPELMALYQAQLGATAPQTRVLEAQPRALPPDLAGLIAAAAASATVAAQQHAAPPAYSAPQQPYAPPAYSPPPPPPQPPPRPSHVSPLRGAQEPTPSQVAAILNEAARVSGASPPQPRTPPPPGTKTGQRSRSDVLPIQGAPPPHSSDPLKPPTQGQQMKTQPQGVPPGAKKTGERRVEPMKQSGEHKIPGSSTSSRSRIPAAEPLKAPTDPYASKTPAPTPPTAGYAPPASAAANGDSPEAREANSLLSTVRAVGIAGEALGNFAGDTMAKLLDEGKIAIAIELGERALALADKGNFEAALATRLAFKTCMKSALLVQRALELLEKNLATPQGPAWVPRAAQRMLKLIDPEVPPDPRDTSVLGRLAAIAKKG